MALQQLTAAAGSGAGSVSPESETGGGRSLRATLTAARGAPGSCSSSCLQPWDGANVSVTPQPPPQVALRGHGAKRSGTHGAAPTARGRGKIGREGL